MIEICNLSEGIKEEGRKGMRMQIVKNLLSL